MFGHERTSHDITVLNALIETTLDSVDGYHRAAQDCPSRRFRSAFMDRVNERQQIIHLLSERVRQLGAQPEDEGSILAKAHRFFLMLRDRVDDEAVMSEVDHGERYLAGKWDSALDDPDLTPETRQLLSGCYQTIRRGHEEWRRSNPDISSSDSGVGRAFELAGAAAGSASSA